MFGPVLGFLGALLLALAAVAAVFIIGMRTKSSIVQGAVIALTKRGFNRVALRTAGQPGAYAARIHHIGRTSGRPYETPVGAVLTADGFLISLPYGLRSQWVRNVLANGSATLDFEGETYDLVDPQIIPLDPVATAFSPSDQSMHRIFAVQEVLRLRRADTEELAAAA